MNATERDIANTALSCLDGYILGSLVPANLVFTAFFWGFLVKPVIGDHLFWTTYLVLYFSLVLLTRPIRLTRV